MSKNIIRTWNNITIRQREDGHLSATDMCKACGKLFGNWNKLDTTKEYLEALQRRNYSDQNNTQWVESQPGNIGEKSGTWVHRRVAVRLAQWLDPDFAVQVDEWVEEILTTGRVEIAPSPQPKEPSETELFSQKNYDMAKKIGQHALELAQENNQLKTKIQELETRLNKLEPPSLPPSGGMKLIDLLRVCGFNIAPHYTHLFSKLALDIRAAVKAGELPKDAIATSGYKHSGILATWINHWFTRA